MAKDKATGLLQSLTDKGLPRPLRRGLFQCDDKQIGATSQKWVELYRDKFVFTKPARDSRAAFAPEAEVPLSSVEDLEIMEDGFELKTKDKKVFSLRGPQPQRDGELDLWFDALARVFEDSNLDFVDSLPVKRPSREGTLAADSTREVGTDDEVPGESEVVQGDAPPRKLTGPGESSAGKGQNPAGLSSLTAKGVEKAICQGTFGHEIGDGAAVSDRLVELYKDRLILFQQAKDQRRAFRPDILLPLSEIEDVVPTEDGFELKRSDGEVDVFHGPRDGQLDPWLENLGQLLRRQEAMRQRSRGLTRGSSSASKGAADNGSRTTETAGNKPRTNGSSRSGDGQRDDQGASDGEAVTRNGSVRFGTETTVREYRPTSSGSTSTLGDGLSSKSRGAGGSSERKEGAEAEASEGCSTPARERVESLFDKYSALDDDEQDEADRSEVIESMERGGTPSSSSKATATPALKTSTAGSAKTGTENSLKTSTAGSAKTGTENSLKTGTEDSLKTSTAGSAKTSESNKTGKTGKWPLFKRFGSAADFEDEEDDGEQNKGHKGQEATPATSRRHTALVSEAREAVQRLRASSKASALSRASAASSSKASGKSSANGTSVAGSRAAAAAGGLSDDELAEIIAKALAAQAAGEGETPHGLADSLAMAAESFSSSEALSLGDIAGQWKTHRGEPRKIETNGRVSCGDDVEDYYIEEVALDDSKVLSSPNGWIVDARRSVPGALLVWQKPGKGRKEWRREDAGRLPLPKDATVRSWLSSLKDPVVVQGPLSFQCKGKLVQRFAVLFKDRLDTWDHAPCSHHGHAPEGRMYIKGLRNVQTVGKGLLVVYKSRRLGIHTQSEQEAQAWSIALRAVCAGAGTKPEDIAVYTKARKSLVAGLKDGSLVEVLRNMEKKAGQAGHCKKHSCKNHGLKQSAEVYAPPMRPVSDYPKNPW